MKTQIFHNFHANLIFWTAITPINISDQMHRLFETRSGFSKIAAAIPIQKSPKNHLLPNQSFKSLFRLIYHASISTYLYQLSFMSILPINYFLLFMYRPIPKYVTTDPYHPTFLSVSQFLKRHTNSSKFQVYPHPQK